MYFEDLKVSMTMRLEKITISGQALFETNFTYREMDLTIS